MKYFLLLSLIFCLMACSSRPKLYPNNVYKLRGKEDSEADIDKCIASADAYLKPSKDKQVAKGASTGGAAGAVAGVFSGNVAGSALRGAAVGGAINPEKIKQSFVDQCLIDKGYRVLGWD